MRCKDLIRRHQADIFTRSLKAFREPVGCGAHPSTAAQGRNQREGSAEAAVAEAVARHFGGAPGGGASGGSRAGGSGRDGSGSGEGAAAAVAESYRSAVPCRSIVSPLSYWFSIDVGAEVQA